MSYRRTTGLLLAGLLVLLAGSSVAMAETELLGLRVSGDVEVGGRVFADRPPKRDRAKFEEYRDLPESALLERLRLRGDSKDDSYTVEIWGENGGQDDQNFQLHSYEVGRFDFEFEWDETPHILSTTSRTLLVEGPDNVFTLDVPRPALADFNTAPRIDDIGFRTDTARVTLSYTPTPDWDIGVEYRRIHKHGDRLLGLAFSTPGGNAIEIPGAINETTHGVHLNAGFAGDGYQLQFGYDASIFNNDFRSFEADNPLVAVDGVGDPSRGRGSLPPDNMAHTVSLAGGVNLPMRTRVNSSFSFSWLKQDENFLPHTINTALAGDPSLVLPQSDLDADVNVYRFNLSATSRPIDPLTLGAKFRFFKYDDNTGDINFAGHVESDDSLQGPQTAHRHPYETFNAGVDARYQIVEPVAVKVAFDWERWNREVEEELNPVVGAPNPVLHEPREVEETDEYTPKVMLDVTPLDWVLFRVSYAYSKREGSDYEQPNESMIPTARKYTMADRDRDRVDVLADLTLMENLFFTATANYTNDDYDADFGVREEHAWAAGFDVTWKPLEWLSIFGGYMHEHYVTEQLSGQRGFTAPPPFFPAFPWDADTEDRYDTVRVGAEAVLIPKRLEGGVNWSYSRGRTEMNTHNIVPGAAGGAVAQDLPTIRSTLSLLNVFLRYWISERFTAKVAYSFEKFDEKDWRADDLLPFNAAAGADVIFLGNDVQDYTAHYFTISIGYHF